MPPRAAGRAAEIVVGGSAGAAAAELGPDLASSLYYRPPRMRNPQGWPSIVRVGQAFWLKIPVRGPRGWPEVWASPGNFSLRVGAGCAVGLLPVPVRGGVGAARNENCTGLTQIVRFGQKFDCKFLSEP